MHTQANNQYQGSSSVSGKLPSGSLHSISQQQYAGESFRQGTQKNGYSSQNPSFVQSPPKLSGTTRKPSGKGTQSNRAAIAKK